MARPWGIALAVAALASCAALIVGVRLLATDITVTVHGNDDVPAFCGSAYDVTYMKRNGYMGGEYPINQAEIDAACRDKAAPYSHRGLVLALAGAGSLGLVGSASLSKLRRRPASSLTP